MNVVSKWVGIGWEETTLLWLKSWKTIEIAILYGFDWNFYALGSVRRKLRYRHEKRMEKVIFLE